MTQYPEDTSMEPYSGFFSAEDFTTADWLVLVSTFGIGLGTVALFMFA